MVKATKYEAEDMKTELLVQNKQIEQLGENIDKTEANMIRVDSSMKKLLKNSNQWLLWGIVIVELVLLIVILFVLP